jgi:hypothetical protein
MAITADPPGIAGLKRLNQQLAGLLEDYHPGLITWRLALANVLLNMAQFSGDPGTIDAASAALLKAR